MLIDRANLIDETEMIRKQNEELRTLLRQYVGSRINEELFVPPSLVSQYQQSQQR